MVGFFKIAGAALALAASLVNGVSFVPEQFDATTAATPANPWAFYNVTIFAARPGYGASYVHFNVQNNDQGVTSGSNYSTFCSAVAFPPDAVNGGAKPAAYATGGLQGGCSNINATWSWDGKQFESTYYYGSGQLDQNGNEYICTVFGYGATNTTTLATKAVECGTAQVASKIPVTSAAAVC